MLVLTITFLLTVTALLLAARNASSLILSRGEQRKPIVADIPDAGAARRLELLVEVLVQRKLELLAKENLILQPWSIYPEEAEANSVPLPSISSHADATLPGASMRVM